MTAITHEQAISGMVIWEAVLEFYRNTKYEHPKYLSQDIGACAHRDECLELAKYTDAAWEYAAEVHGYDDCYDWDFVPRFLAEARSADEIRRHPFLIVKRMLKEPK